MQNEFLTRIKPFIDSYSELNPIATKTSSEINKIEGIEAIIFDIYGTLIISASGDLDKSSVTTQNLTKAIEQGGWVWVSNAENEHGKELLQEFHSAVEEQQLELKKKGHPYPEVDIIAVWDKCITKALNLNWLKAKSSTCLKTLTVVFEILSNPVWPMPKMNSIITELQKLKMPLGIVSNAQFYTPIIMNQFISNSLTEQENIIGFDNDISVFSYKILRSKPDTYLFELLAEKLKSKYGFNSNQILFVGNDMLKDVWTAKQAGFKTALFAGDERSLRLRTSDNRCKDLKADIIINDLSELLLLLETN